MQEKEKPIEGEVGKKGYGEAGKTDELPKTDTGREWEKKPEIEKKP
jgi:hypothetical protein